MIHPDTVVVPIDHADEYSDNGCTISITYDISPKKTDWKDMGDGLYRSTDKFVRTKSGTVKDIKYTISGAPSGLTVGEIKTDSSMKHIDDDELVELSVRVAGKLESISDEEYARLVLEAAE